MELLISQLARIIVFPQSYYTSIKQHGVTSRKMRYLWRDKNFEMTRIAVLIQGVPQ